MSQHSIQPYEPAPLHDAVLGTDPPADDQPSSVDMAWLLAALRRRWALILLIWLFLATLGAAVIQMKVRPTYTATALIELTPVIRSILRGDDQVMPEYGTYLHTQAELITSRPVLLDALQDPAAKDVPLQQAPDPAGTLRRCVSVSNPQYTQLLQVDVLQEDSQSAINLAQAVLSAYTARAGGLDAQATRLRRQTLEARRGELLETLERQEQEIQKLAGEYGTSNETTFADLRKGIEQISQQTRQELEQTRREIIAKQQQLQQLDRSVLPEEFRLAREQLIENDAGVRWIRHEIADQQTRITRLAATTPESGRAIQDARQELARLQARLETERKRATVEADKEVQRRHQDRLEDTRQQLHSELAAAEYHRDMLQQLVDEQNNRGQALGKTEAQIKTIGERRDRTKQDYEQVLKALTDIDVERQAPARINVASAPEIRPDGIKDKRKKLSAAAVAGALLVAMGLGLLRDRVDPHLRNMQEVKTGIGLRVLGAVPSVAELHSGRVTKEHFLESYRVIRETLASMAPDGEAPKSILVTSAQAGEGKTSLAVSLAISLTELGSRVLLIDGDVQAPQIGKLLNLNPPCSLRSVLAEQRRVADAAVASNINGLDVLITRTNGDAARHLLNARTARRVLREAAGAYDYIVIDSPPALGAADALVWAHAADGVVVSSLVGLSDRNAIRLACQRLQSVGAHLLGSVIANVSVNETYYSYSTTSCAAETGPASLAQHGTKRRCPPLVHLPDTQKHATADQTDKG